MRHFLALLALLALGCGHRALIEFTDVKPTRQSDDRVNVVSQATCKAMMGHSECGALCVTATWVTTTGATVDTVRVCDPANVVNGASRTFTLLSKTPIPPGAGTKLRLEATSSYAGQWQALPFESLSP